MAPKLEIVRSGTASAVEPPSFERLYDEQFDFTWRVLRHLGLSGAPLDDAAQEVWLAVHRRLEDFEARSDVHTWLFGIAFNVVRNHRRRAQRRATEELPVQLEAPGPGPEALHAVRETLGSVQRFLGGLGEQDRAIFACNLMERLSAAETAETVGVEVGIVYQRIRVLRRMLERWCKE